MDPTAFARLVVPLAALAMLLGPVVTHSLPTAAEGAARASLNLAVTLAVVLLGLANPRRRANLALPWSPLMVGVGLYAAAAMLGGVVALVRGNETHLVAGQLLSMGLLPLAALGGWMHGSVAGMRRFAVVVSGMSSAACLVAFAFGVVRLAHGQDPRRFSFPNGAAPTGAAMLAALLGLALGATSKGWRRHLAFGAVGIVAAYTLISSVRSLWLAGTFAVVVFALVAWGKAAIFRPWLLRAAAVLLAVTASAAALSVLWWGHARPNLLSRLDERVPGPARPVLESATGPEVHAPDIGSVARIDALSTPEMPAAAYRVRGEVLFRGPGRVQVGVWPAGSGSDSEPLVVADILASKAGAKVFSEVAVSRRATMSLEVRLRDTRGTSEGLKGVTFERLGPAWLGSLIVLLDRGVYRPVDPDAGSGESAFASDASLAFRFKETRAVLREFLRSSWTARVLGHGLGARFQFAATGYDRTGNIVGFENPNYIHNFYVFLLFKLGFAGLVAVGAALFLWILVPAISALRLTAGDPRRVFLAAHAAVWFGYSVWSLAAPEILDFRLAPLWGFLLAAAPLGVPGPVESPTLAESTHENHDLSRNAGQKVMGGGHL
ncbi:MAG: hypothetical protein LAO05_09710 [Acidobacteriia bacterium]|nr:hypothetical protein [Terriglobia bacterium]